MEIIPDLTFHREIFADAMAEVMGLSALHNDEVNHFINLPVNIDWDRYLALNAIDLFHFFTVRSKGELVGYSGYFVSTHSHHKEHLMAVQDSIFIRKDKRGCGKDFIVFCDTELKNAGVFIVFNAVKVTHDFGQMLEGLGYQKVDIIYGKRLTEEAQA